MNARKPNGSGASEPAEQIRTCIIHVGMGKSGSTAIQSAFRAIRSDRIVYADLPSKDQGLDAIAMFSSRLAPLSGYVNVSQHALLARGERLRERLRRQIAQDRRDLFISGESISVYFGVDEVEAAIRFLSPHFGRIRVLAYIREPFGYIKSLHIQTVRFASLNPAGMFLQYRRAFEPWVAALGEPNVDLVPYERTRLPEGDVLRDVEVRLGLARSTLTATKSNVSPGAEGYAILFANYRKLNAGRLSLLREAQLRAELRPARAYGGRSFSLAPEACASIVADNRGEIDWIESHMGVPFATPENAEITFNSEDDILRFAQESRAAFAQAARRALGPINVARQALRIAKGSHRSGQRRLGKG